MSSRKRVLLHYYKSPPPLRKVRPPVCTLGTLRQNERFTRRAATAAAAAIIPRSGRRDTRDRPTIPTHWCADVRGVVHVFGRRPGVVGPVGGRTGRCDDRGHGQTRRGGRGDRASHAATGGAAAGRRRQRARGLVDGRGRVAAAGRRRARRAARRSRPGARQPRACVPVQTVGTAEPASPGRPGETRGNEARRPPVTGGQQVNAAVPPPDQTVT